MKKVLFIILLLLYTHQSFAQINLPTNPIQAKAVQDSAMVIQEGVRQIEILSNVRALKQINGTYQSLTGIKSDTLIYSIVTNSLIIMSINIPIGNGNGKNIIGPISCSCIIPLANLTDYTIQIQSTLFNSNILITGTIIILAID